MQQFKKFWASLDSLDDRIFFLTVTVSIVVSVIVYIADILQGLALEAQLAVLAIFFIMVLLFFLGLKYPAKRTIFRICLVITLNFILFPLSFFYSGGIQSGMILFYLTGLFLVPVMTRGKASIILFVLSIFMMIVTIEMAQYVPSIVVPMTLSQHYQDVKITLLIAGIGLYLITVLILGSYNQERIRNEKLMESLRNLSEKDALSGLYNRRELYRRLEIMYGKPEVSRRKNTLVCEDHYIAMFDIDDFKKINDTYGHGVGDAVLKAVANVLNEMVDLKNGELAARYGGEEFVCVLYAPSIDEAYRRVEEARLNVAALQFGKGFPSQITISGGVVSCTDTSNLTEIMKRVDALLYEAKANGKNRICRTDSE